MKVNPRNNLGILQLAAVGVGGYLLWLNRFRIQRALEASGIKTPLLNSDASETVQSGIAKVAGKFDRAVNYDQPRM